MLVFVIGGSGSGKSEYAEQRILNAGEMARFYVATMEASSDEGQKRIRRHRKLRSGKGFTTVECPVHPEQVQLQGFGAVLLEDLSNLLANEIWSVNGRGWDHDPAGQICETIFRWSEEHQLVVVVGNDIHRDGDALTPELVRYFEVLGDCHRRLAAAADEVIEVVCGIPLRVKG